MKVTSRQEDDPVSASDEAKVKEAHMGNNTRNFGVGNFTNCEAELETIGWPLADSPLIWKYRTMVLNVYYPYGLNGESSGILSWTRKGENGLDPYLSGHWLINEASHIIDETGYKTKMVISRVIDPDTQGMNSGDQGPKDE
mgnify:CR=1 FL=1